MERVAEAMARWQTRGIEVDRHASVDTIRHPVRLANVATRSNDADVRHLVQGILKASGRTGVPQGGVLSPLRRHRDLTEVDRRLARAKEVTRSGPYTERA